MKKHLIFFDGTCALCNRTVRFVMRIDKKQQFQFEPLQGALAKNLLHNPPTDTMVLLENQNTAHPRKWLRGRAAFRILWLLGGPWKPLGLLCFLPFGVDAAYRFIARHRHLF